MIKCKNYKSRVPEFLKLKKMNQRALSLEYNISEISIYRWINLNNYPPLNALLKLAKEFNTNLSYLVGMTKIDAPIETYKPKLELEKLMEESGYSCRSLADKLETSLTIIREYIEEPRYSRVTTLIAMADALDVSLDYLLGLTPICKWEQVALKKNPFYLCSAGQPVYIYAYKTAADGSVEKAEGNGLIHADGKSVIFPSGRIVNMNDKLFENTLAIPLKVPSNNSVIKKIPEEIR